VLIFAIVIKKLQSIKDMINRSSPPDRCKADLLAGLYVNSTTVNVMATNQVAQMLYLPVSVF
jgi:hypothetical protein